MCGHHARALWVGTSEPDQKVGPLGGPFDQPQSQNHVFEIFRGEPPTFSLKTYPWRA